MGRSTQSPPARPLDLRPRLFPLLLLVGANLIWGGSYTVMKLALTGLTPYQVSLWRMLPAGLLALPLLVWQLRRHAMPGRVWPVLGVVALLAFVGTKLLEVVGVNLSSATNAALLLSMEPLFTLALGVVVLKERISRRRGASFLLGVFGAYVLISRGLRPPEWSAAHVTGDLLFLLGLTFEATTTIIGARYARRYPALLVTMATITLSLGVWLPLGLAEVLGPGAPDFTPQSLAALAYLSVGCTLLGYWAWFHALESMEAGLAALTLFVQPIFGTLLAVVVLGEPFSLPTLGGGMLVFTGLYLALAPAGLPAALWEAFWRGVRRKLRLF